MSFAKYLRVVVLVVPSLAIASEPASHDVNIPTSNGQVVVVEWTGTALPGSHGGGSTCPPEGADDRHDINLVVPDNAYETLEITVSAHFHIDWDIGTPDPSGSFTDPDLVLTVVDGVFELGSSDGGAPEENVTLENLESGTYSAIVCPFAASEPTDYRGRLTLTATLNKACAIPKSTTETRAIAHSTVPSGPANALAQERAGFANLDVYKQDIAAVEAAVPAGFGGRRQNTLFDRRMGKPTFLWARNDAATPAVGALNPRDLLIGRARVHLRNEATALQLTAAMIEEAEVTNAQYNGKGPAVVSFQQVVNGIEVHDRSLNVLLDLANRPVAVSGYFATDYGAGVVPGFARSAPQAIAAAWTNLGGTVDAALLTAVSTQGPWQRFSTPELSGSHVFEREPRAKPVYYARAGGLEPAHHVELFAVARATGQLIAYSFVVSAVDGRVLQRTNLKKDAAHSYRVFASDNGIHQPFDNPLGNEYTPFPGSNPTEQIERNGASTKLITLDHAGIVTGDPWLPEGATETLGNNVDACLDSFDNAGSGVVSNPANTCDPELGDMRPPPSGPNSFDYPIEADGDPSTADAQAAAIVNLFYINNWLHDWWYNHGFDEASGNAQNDNYGRGGLDGDRLKAQGQDSSGRNNANMATPSDGSSPTMQQYLFDGPPVGEVRETAPTDTGPLVWAAAAFGPDSYDIAAEIELADDGAGISPSDGCGEAPPDPTAPTPAAPAQASLAGKIALIDRGSCNFTSKAQFATSSGAIGMIVVNNTDGEPIVMGNGDVPINAGASPSDPAYNIPSVMIRRVDGNAIKADLATATVTGLMQREPATDVDGTLDNQIIAHEFFHYVHQRLARDQENQSGSMSEGWGDINSFMLSTRANERQLAGNGQYQGAYALATYVSNNFYVGIRRVPYSTDFSKNAFTFKHISDGEPTPDGGSGANNSEVHNAGEIWANAVWECYVGLLNRPEHRFDQAQDRMQDYIIGGLKMTPDNATYTEARDAILAVVLATDPADYAACSAGFARRGMGLNAVSPARESEDHAGVVESYEPFVAPVVAPCGVKPRRYSIFSGSLALGSLGGLLALAGLRRHRNIIR